MHRKKPPLLALALVLLVLLLAGIGILVWKNLDRQTVVSSSETGNDRLGATEEERSAIVNDSEITRPTPASSGRDPRLPPCLLDDLNSPESSPEDDVRLLSILFADYQSVFKRMPLGTHQEMVALLQGNNRRSIAFIPKGHPAVSERNEIVDRWGKPYFFHVISRSAVEIISAGPDGSLFTHDDIRNSPVHASVEPDFAMHPESL